MKKLKSNLAAQIFVALVLAIVVGLLFGKNAAFLNIFDSFKSNVTIIRYMYSLMKKYIISAAHEIMRNGTANPPLFMFTL